MYCLRKLFRKKRQIVVLLGAGAAMPWGGIKSETLKEELIKDTTYKTPDGKTIGQYLFDILDGFYGADNTNFETFFAALEVIMNYIINSTNVIPAIFNLKETINELLVGKTEKEKRKYCVEMFQTYVNIVINAIDEYNKKALSDKKYKEVSNNLVQFTKYFLSKNYSVKYYTTNYDNVIAKVLSKRYHIYEGLCDVDGSIKQFNYDLALFKKARLSHFNLHGSVFLFHKMLEFYKTVYDAEGSHTLSELSALHENSGNPGERLLFSPIITGHNKTQRATNQPFSLGFNAFINDCNDCHALCVVGYSVSDPHINAVLSSYIKWKNIRFVYVTQSDNFKTKLENVTQIIGKSSDETWLHGDGKHIYIKGFEEFLKDKSNWEYLNLK
jgi:hypothetical protein